MGSRIKKLLFGKSSTSGNPNLKGRSYDSAVASDPPVKGLYPIAGNGPNVLDEIQRSRTKKDAARRQSTTAAFAAAATIPRLPEDFIERPRTAPHSGRPGGGYSARADNGRTRSDFSMKSPPPFFSSSRRNSIQQTAESPRPVPTPISRTSTPKLREIKTYQPKKATQPAEADVPDTFSPPFALHYWNLSQISHKSYVDLLEAHSNIRPSRDVSKHRAKASGVRNYGEDVADRNMADSGDRENRLDLNFPEFSYLKSVYASKKGGVAVPREGRSHSRAASVGHVLGQEHTASDDIQHLRNHTKANSTRSVHSNSSRPAVAVYPPRSDSTSALSSTTNSGRDDHRSAISNVIPDHKAKALSPLSATTASIYKEPEETGRTSAASTRSTNPLQARERSRTLTRESRNPPPVSLPTASPRFAAPTQSQQPLPVTGIPSLKQRRRTMSEASQTTVASGTKSRNGSVSYSAFPSPSRHDAQQNNEAPAQAEQFSTMKESTGMIVEGAKEQLSLKGVVDLSNTVDTDVTTKTLPAVTHEKVLPTRHEIREERITREIHTHDVFHRVLPIIETEILPPKHYVPSPDGRALIEIPEHMIPGRTANGSPSRNWEIVQTGMGGGDHGSVLHKKTTTQRSNIDYEDAADAPVIGSTRGEQRADRSRANIEEDDGADAPVVGFARGEPKAHRSRANSRTSIHTRGNSRTLTHTPKTSKTKNILEPILSSKKEYVTKEGHPKTEYVWRHPPVFKTTNGQTQPVYVGAGLGDISSPTTAPISGETYYSDEDDIEGAEFGAMRKPAKGEEELLFRDIGYGSQGILPGLVEKTPLAGLGSEQSFDPADFELIRYGRVIGEDEDAAIGKAKVVSNAEGEAIMALRLKEKRMSSGAGAGAASAVKANENGDLISEVERGMNGLNVQE